MPLYFVLHGTTAVELTALLEFILGDTIIGNLLNLCSELISTAGAKLENPL